MAEALRISNLHVRYNAAEGQVKALNGVNLVQQEEEIYCLVGESGSGKSTLALAIMGLLPQSASITGGSIVFNGVDLLSASPDYMRELRGNEVSMVFQDAQSALNPVHLVGPQLEEVILAHTDVTARTANRMAQDILREMGLPDPRRIMGSYPFSLSGGMCQRIMLGIALVLSPKLLIADEPTSGLDVTLQAEILERLKRLCVEQHASILLITHDMGVVAHMARNVGIIYAGSMVETADVISVFKEPQHPYTWSLLQSLPRLDRVDQSLRSLPGSPPDMVNLTGECPFLPRCSKAVSRCRNEPMPVMTEPSQGHLVACYNPIGPAEAVP